MLELSETGLMNFLLLFLVLGRQVELQDVACRACELLAVFPASCPPGHRTLVWRGQLALLLLFQVPESLPPAWSFSLRCLWS